MRYASVLDGYLTPDCAECEDWSDGTDGRGLGCNIRVPIDRCPAFKKLMESYEGIDIRLMEDDKRRHKEVRHE